jgi:hypothetical protein
MTASPLKADIVLRPGGVGLVPIRDIQARRAKGCNTRRVSITPRTKRSWIVHLKVKGGSRFLDPGY